MMPWLKRNYAILVLNILAIAVFTIFHLSIQLPPRGELIFSTPDARTYFDVAQWISSGADTESLSVRPLLYPFLLLMMHKIGGTIGVFVIQSLMWLAAINMSFLSIKRISGNIIIAFSGVVILMSNLSLLALTAHAITEVTTVFILSLTTFLLLKHRASYQKPSFLLMLLACLIALTLVKPVFFLPSILVLVCFFIFHLKSIFTQKKNVVLLGFIILPLFGQMTLMHYKFDRFTVSLVGSQTFSRYFVTQGIEQIEGLEHQAAVTKADGFSGTEKLKYLYDHKSNYLNALSKNVKGNIQGDPIFLNYPAEFQNKSASRFMDHYNELTCYLHILMLIFGLLLIFVLWRKKAQENLVLLIILLGLNSYFLLVSGVSFWQGDRLTLPAIAIWTVLYPLMIFWGISYFKLFKSKD
jgi:hypothetical protein